MSKVITILLIVSVLFMQSGVAEALAPKAAVEKVRAVGRNGASQHNSHERSVRLVPTGQREEIKQAEIENLKRRHNIYRRATRMLIIEGGLFFISLASTLIYIGFAGRVDPDTADLLVRVATYSIAATGGLGISLFLTILFNRSAYIDYQRIQEALTNGTLKDLQQSERGETIAGLEHFNEWAEKRIKAFDERNERIDAQAEGVKAWADTLPRRIAAWIVVLCLRARRGMGSVERFSYPERNLVRRLGRIDGIPYQVKVRTLQNLIRICPGDIFSYLDTDDHELISIILCKEFSRNTTFLDWRWKVANRMMNEDERGLKRIIHLTLKGFEHHMISAEYALNDKGAKRTPEESKLRSVMIMIMRDLFYPLGLCNYKLADILLSLMGDEEDFQLRNFAREMLVFIWNDIYNEEALLEHGGERRAEIKRLRNEFRIAVSTALGSPHPLIRQGALFFIRDSGVDIFTEKVEALYEHDENQGVRLAAAEALQVLGKDVSLPIASFRESEEYEPDGKEIILLTARTFDEYEQRIIEAQDIIARYPYLGIMPAVRVEGESLDIDKTELSGEEICERTSLMIVRPAMVPELLKRGHTITLLFSVPGDHNRTGFLIDTAGHFYGLKGAGNIANTIESLTGSVWQEPTDPSNTDSGLSHVDMAEKRQKAARLLQEKGLGGCRQIASVRYTELFDEETFEMIPAPEWDVEGEDEGEPWAVHFVPASSLLHYGRVPFRIWSWSERSALLWNYLKPDLEKESGAAIESEEQYVRMVIDRAMNEVAGLMSLGLEQRFFSHHNVDGLGRIVDFDSIRRFKYNERDLDEFLAGVRWQLIDFMGYFQHLFGFDAYAVLEEILQIASLYDRMPPDFKKTKHEKKKEGMDDLVGLDTPWGEICYKVDVSMIHQVRALVEGEDALEDTGPFDFTVRFINVGFDEFDITFKGDFEVQIDDDRKLLEYLRDDEDISKGVYFDTVSPAVRLESIEPDCAAFMTAIALRQTFEKGAPFVHGWVSRQTHEKLAGGTIISESDDRMKVHTLIRKGEFESSEYGQGSPEQIWRETQTAP